MALFSWLYWIVNDSVQAAECGGWTVEAIWGAKEAMWSITPRCRLIIRSAIDKLL